MPPTPEKDLMLPKKFRLISSAALAIIGLIFVRLLLARDAQMMSMMHVSAAQTTAPPSGAAQQLPPGTIPYTAKAATTALFLARLHLTNSSYMTVAELEDAIRAANGGKAVFKKGETALVPGTEPQPGVEKSRPFPKDGEVRAIYLTGSFAGSAKGVHLILRSHKAHCNAPL